MNDNVTKAHRARLDALDRHNAAFDKRRNELLAQMARLNEQLADLQQEQNATADKLMQEHDAAYAKARIADSGEPQPTPSGDPKPNAQQALANIQSAASALFGAKTKT